MANIKSKSDVLKKREKKRKKSLVLTFFKWSLIGFIILVVLGGAGITGLFVYLSQDLPKINTLNDYRPATVTSVFSDDGRKIGEFYKERRIVIPLAQMPENLINAFVAAEDSGIGVADIALMARHTPFVSGLQEDVEHGGDPSPSTAYGVYLGIRTAVNYRLGTGHATKS